MGWEIQRTLTSSTCVAMSTGCGITMRQPETACWRREDVDVDKLFGDPFNPKPKSSTAVGSAEPPLDHQMGRATTIDHNVNREEESEEQTQEAATQKRWYVTEVLVREHGRPRCCPRCGNGLGIHNAECWRRIEGILLQQSRMKPKERCTATSYCNDDEIGADAGEAHGASNAARRQQLVRKAGRCRLQLHNKAVARSERSKSDDEMDTEEPCTTPSCGGGHGRCVRPDTGPNPSVNTDESASDDEEPVFYPTDVLARYPV